MTCNHAAMAGSAVWTRERLQEQHSAPGRLYHEVVRADAVSAGIYRLAAGATDPQVPHLVEDEVYVVVAGICAIEIDGRRETVSAGSLVYVPRGVPHQFVDIVEDLEVVVVFAPPETA